VWTPSWTLRIGASSTGRAVRKSSALPGSVQPALYVRSKPAPATTGALFWERTRTHPAIDGAAVRSGDSLHVARAEHLVNPSYGLGGCGVPFESAELQVGEKA
jgi:hypothetical protein